MRVRSIVRLQRRGSSRASQAWDPVGQGTQVRHSTQASRDNMMIPPRCMIPRTLATRRCSKSMPHCIYTNTTTTASARCLKLYLAATSCYTRFRFPQQGTRGEHLHCLYAHHSNLCGAGSSMHSRRRRGIAWDGMRGWTSRGDEDGSTKPRCVKFHRNRPPYHLTCASPSHQQGIYVLPMRIRVSTRSPVGILPHSQVAPHHTRKVSGTAIPPKGLWLIL